MTRGTIITVVIALASFGAALASAPKDLPPPQFEDTGEDLFEGFSDPTLATSLDVKVWDEEEAKVKQFKVEQKEGRWVIPSHHDYPADGTEQMGKAAASFVDVKKDIYYGDNPADHANFGVLDPEGTEGKGDERGKRITIKDASGTVLVDVIVGKAVEGKEGYLYVRAPEEKRVYGSKLTLDVSTDFTDWIEKDLLRIERDDVVTFQYDPYKVDEAQAKVTGSNPVLASLVPGEDGAKSWTLEEAVEIPAGKEFDDKSINTVVGAIDRLKIVGVRPRPQPLTLPALQAFGFFVTPDGRRLFGNEGQVRVALENGVVYSLYFGEVTYDSGLALTAGTEPGGEDGAKDEEDTGATANRYLFVDVVYDPNLDRSKAAKADGAGAPQGGTDEAETEGGWESEGGDGGENAEPAPDGDGAAETRGGEEIARELQQRFDGWFFVISDASFKQIHKDRESFFKDPKPESGE